MKKLDTREMRIVEAGKDMQPNFLFNIANDTITAAVKGIGTLKIFFEYFKIGTGDKKFPILAYIQKISFRPDDMSTGLGFRFGKHWTDGLGD